jgi:hypothetical protein
MNHLLFGKTEFYKTVTYSSALSGLIYDEQSQYLITKIIKRNPNIVDKEQIENVLSSFSSLVSDKNPKATQLCVNFISNFLNLIKETKEFDSYLKENMNNLGDNASFHWILGTNKEMVKAIKDSNDYSEFQNYIINKYEDDFLNNEILKSKIMKYSSKNFWTETEIFNNLLNNIQVNSFFEMIRKIRIDFLTDDEFTKVVRKNINALEKIDDTDNATNTFKHMFTQGVLRVKDDEFDNKFLIVLKELNDNKKEDVSNKYFNLYVNTLNSIFKEKFLKMNNSKSDKKEEFLSKKTNVLNLLVQEQQQYFKEEELASMNELVKNFNKIVLTKEDIITNKIKKTIDHFILSYELVYTNLFSEKTMKKKNKI